MTLCIFTITLNMITFEEKALNNFQICRLSSVKNDNIPTAILKCCLLALFLCVIILMLMLFCKC